MNKDLKILFLVYVARSGSTFLSQLLAKHSYEIVVLPEIKAVEILISIGDVGLFKMSSTEILEKLKLDPRWNSLEITDDVGIGLVRSKRVATIVSSICSYYTSRQSKVPKYVIIKNSTAIWQYHLLKKHFDDFVLLHIKRDIRGSCASRYLAKSSFHEDRKPSEKSIVQIAKYWTDYVNRVNYLKKTQSQIFELEYEELIRNKLKAIQSLLKFLDISFVSDTGIDLALSNREITKMHRNVYSGPITQRITGWKNDLRQREGYIVEYIGRNHIRDFYFSKDISLKSKVIFLLFSYLKYYWVLILKLPLKLFSFRKNNIFSVTYQRLRFKFFRKYKHNT